MATQQRQADRDGRASTRPAYDVVLGPVERVPERPFTEPAETQTDALVMSAMLASERRIARTWEAGVTGPGISETTQGGGRQLLAVPDGRALLAARDVTAVGFFGSLREGVDHDILFEHERLVARRFPHHAPLGFLSYFDVGPEHGRYGNLILFWTADVPMEWHRDAAHRAAVALAPDHYEHIRLHRGRIPGRFMGDGELRIERTQYLDFSGERPWRALRVYAEVRSPGRRSGDRRSAAPHPAAARPPRGDAGPAAHRAPR
jgi:hypothetical protein